MCYCVSSGLESLYFNFLMVLRQKIDVIASDVKGGAGKGKKELWQLSDESEASQPSADDEEAGNDEDVSEDGSVDSDGGGGALAARKPRPAKLIAVSSNDADRRQQRQVVCSLCLMSCGMCPGRVRSVTRSVQDDLRYEDSRRMRELMSTLHSLADAKAPAAVAPPSGAAAKASSSAAASSSSSLASKSTPARPSTSKPRFSSGSGGAAAAGGSGSGRR